MKVISNEREKSEEMLTIVVSSFVFPMIIVFVMVNTILSLVDYICGKKKNDR